MKTIFLPIFLFVCFVNTQAQNDTTWHVIESGILNSGISTFTGMIDGTVVSIAGWELAGKPFDKFYNSSNPITRDLNMWLLKLLDKYKKECYADRGTERIWRHKETSFEGFIAWLRKQSNK